VRAIEAGRNAVSVGMQIAERRVSRLPDPVTMIRQARLLDVALLINGETPAYPGARAKVFRAFRDDPAELRKNIADVIEHARWHSRPRY
jgi:phage head maturation protease